VMNDIQICYADDSDLPYLIQNDSLVTEEIIKKKISDRQVIVYIKGEMHLGCMRFGFGWDMFPFLNFIIVEKDVRRKGIGRELMEFWEQEMMAKGHKLVMTSTDVDEEAQHFYRKLGYRDSGGILFPQELFPASVMELVLFKILK
jgi:ribosomal protein S18 acetylase RimI-like enzyme